MLEFPDRALIKSLREHADRIIKQLSDDGVTLREAILIAKRMDHVLMKYLERDPDTKLSRLLNI